MAIRARLDAGGDGAFLDECGGGWKTLSLRARCIFFVLGIAAAALTAAIFELLHIPAFALASGLVLWALAEWLVIGRRLFGAGIEEALELSGLLLIVFWILNSTGNLREAGVALLVASVLMAAGLRFLNPLFATLSASALSLALHAAVSQAAASAFCFAAGVIALGLGAKRLRRPAYEEMLNFLVIAMPLAAYLWVQNDGGAKVHVLPVFMLLAYGAGAMVTGLRRRTHAPIMACMVCVVCIAYELRNLMGLALEARLILWGSATLALAAALHWYLRKPRRGITSVSLTENEPCEVLSELAGVTVLAPTSPQDSDAPFKGGGGTFGGGGASGSY
jgi:hypothetical protein